MLLWQRGRITASHPCPPCPIPCPHLLICINSSAVLVSACCALQLIELLYFAGESAGAHATNSSVSVFLVGSLCLAFKTLHVWHQTEKKINEAPSSRPVDTQHFPRRTWERIRGACCSPSCSQCFSAAAFCLLIYRNTLHLACLFSKR